MAANKTFTFEDPMELRGSRRAASDGGVFEKTPKGMIPDFTSFGNIDLAAISPAIGVMQQNQKYAPMSRGNEYMWDEEERERGFGENLVFYTGASYIGGFTTGTVLGVFEGLRKGRSLPQKLRMNAVVNACTKRATTLGNNLGVIALMFTTFERLSLYARDKDDALNAISAAALTGGVFKSTSGPRACIAWSIVGGLGMTMVSLSGHLSSVLHRAKASTLDLTMGSQEAKE